LRFFAALRKAIPEQVDFLLSVAVDEERDRFIELEVRTGVQRDERLTVKLEIDGHYTAVGAVDADDLRVLEHRNVEVHCLFGLMVEPEKRGDFIHGSSP